MKYSKLMNSLNNEDESTVNEYLQIAFVGSEPAFHPGGTQALSLTAD